MNSRTKKFFSYYKPYLGLFISVMLCGFLVAIITLLLPLCARYITKNILGTNAPDALHQIFKVGALMLLLVLIHTACNFYVAYRGHTMGAMMESDLLRRKSSRVFTGRSRRSNRSNIFSRRSESSLRKPL